MKTQAFLAFSLSSDFTLSAGEKKGRRSCYDWSLSGVDWEAFAKLFMSVQFVLYCFIIFPPQCFHGLFCKFRNSELAAMWFPDKYLF